ncbi:MAG: potassium-transporting ATPase subunit KdpC [Chthonomonadales bacterium]
MLTQVRAALVALALFTLLTGLVYPLVVTGLAQVFFPRQAEGSLIMREGRPVGSELIGQPFSAAGYFWGRPSVTEPFAYNAAASAGANIGPLDPRLAEEVNRRLAALRAADPSRRGPVPVDLVTASASGLDPNISLAAADYQVARVARARGMSEAEVRRILQRFTVGRQLGFLGEPRVNVLKVNLALDQAQGRWRGGVSAAGSR